MAFKLLCPIFCKILKYPSKLCFKFLIMKKIDQTIVAFAKLNIDADLLDIGRGKSSLTTTEYKTRCQVLTSELSKKLLPALAERPDLGNWYIEFGQLSEKELKYNVTVYAEDKETYKKIIYVITSILAGAELAFWHIFPE